jgi:hypothetical protein
MIYDKHDDAEAGGVMAFEPFLTAPHPDTSVFVEPTSVYLPGLQR